MKATIMFKDDNPKSPMSSRPNARAGAHRPGANDNFRSLEFETEGQERDWRLLCLVSAIVCGLTAFIFLPLW